MHFKQGKKWRKMKKLLFILGILIILDITYFSFVNQGTPLTVNYKPLIGDIQVGSGLLYLFMGAYGAIGGALLVYSRLLALKERLKGLERKAEKTSIISEESQDKVKALQAKIDTLEAALKEALKKNK